MKEWITFLEMVERPKSFPTLREHFHVALAKKNGRINLDWYRRVGAQWAWTDRLKWSDAEWREYVESENFETWIAQYHGEECGYFELSRESEGVRIALLGLTSQSIGKGLGGLAAFQGAGLRLDRGNQAGFSRYLLERSPQCLAELSATRFSNHPDGIEGVKWDW